MLYMEYDAVYEYDIVKCGVSILHACSWSIYEKISFGFWLSTAILCLLFTLFW